MARIELWNGDICDLEVDIIVNAANVTLWMSTGVGGAIKRRGGDSIEFDAVRQGPVVVGDAIVTGAGRLAAKWIVHAVSLDRDRRTSAAAIEASVRSTMARARELGATSMAFPALGTGVGGFPLDEAARVAVDTVRSEAAVSPRIEVVVFALRGSAPFEAFQAALGRADGSSVEQVRRDVEEIPPGVEEIAADSPAAGPLPLPETVAPDPERSA